MSECLTNDRESGRSWDRSLGGISLDLLARIAATPSTVLILGETGSGKGFLARAIHEHSPRNREPFVHVDCTALSPTLIESELFGHIRGAFTGAISGRKGRFELAASGTILLDEIANLDLNAQRKLLRVLDEGIYERVGSSVPIRLNARVIAATNRELSEAVQSGDFRKDLFYRLAVTRIRVPPLRERLDELPCLVDAGLARAAARLNRPVPRSSSELISQLREHCWPGNVRELFNALEHAAAHAPDGRLCLRSCDLDLADHALNVRMARTLREPAFASTASQDIQAVLIATGGNVSRAARRLRIPRSTLRYRILRAGLEHLLVRD